MRLDEIVLFLFLFGITALFLGYWDLKKVRKKSIDQYWNK